MGLTYIIAQISHVQKPAIQVKKKLLVDSGAFYSVVPAQVLKKLGVRPYTRETFTLADGMQIDRDVGVVLFRVNGHVGSTPVIFGERTDTPLLGVLALEAMGLTLDPRTGKLKKIPLLLV